ncbi:unnamed protein product [Acanthoscelides obtectus]|uniref:Uncharacterized protein n=1 Tax=Acanthoscelides obtectus TaxID=200917 RepID=A0A9P0NV44_ACAOB|nr:unnamed protein product [Acanthoscelides obtectus]CAK1667002.1 hypothetical protein AOBTE_LOCUS25615 [Acanthoscelides obtectus]
MSNLFTLLCNALKIVQPCRCLAYTRASTIKIKRLPYNNSIYTVENPEMQTKQRRRCRKFKKVINTVIQQQELRNKFPADHGVYDYEQRRQPRL